VIGMVRNLKEFKFSLLLLFSSALLLETIGSKNNALLILKKAMHIFPHNRELYLHASRLYLKNGQVDKAVMYWKKAAGPENIGSFIYWLERYKKRYPPDNEPIKPTAQSPSTPGKNDLEKKWLAGQAVSGDAGLELLEKGYIEEALQFFLQNLRVGKTDPFLHFNIGLALSKLNRHEEALANYEKAQKMGLNSLELLNNKGYSLFNLHRFDEAQSCYELARGLAPNDYTILNNLAACYLKTNQKEKALDSFLGAAQNNPGDATLENNLAMCLEATGNTPKAIEHYERALSLAKDTQTRKQILINKINCLIKQKQFSEALAICEKLPCSDQEYEIWGLRAELLNELGRTREAAESYRKALGLTG